MKVYIILFLTAFGKNKGLWPLFRNNEMQSDYEGYLTDTFSDEATDFIARNKEQPFFLYLAYNAPHYPLGKEDWYPENAYTLEKIKDKLRTFCWDRLWYVAEALRRLLRDRRDQ